jgi:lipopolysaccharide transport system permease protein
MFRDVVACSELAWRLTVRDISAQYRQSLLGIAWAFIPPLVSALVFMSLQRSNVVSIADPGMPYALFVVIGTTLWQAFAESVTLPLKVATAAKPVLAKTNFAREALVISAFYQSLFGLAIKVILIAGALAFFRVSLGGHTLAAVLPAVMLVWVGTVVGLLLMPIGLLITDIGAGLTLALQLGFFLTPVVYPAPTALPYSLLAALNPAGILITASREWFVHGVAPTAAPIAAVAALTLGGMAFGWLVYRISMPIIIERMSA